MLTITTSEKAKEGLNFTVPLKSIVVLRITLTGAFVAPAIIQARLDDWVDDQGGILPVQVNVSPSYLYISPAASAQVTLTLSMPGEAKAGMISSSIHFSGFDGCSLSMKIKLTETVETDNTIIENYINITLPFANFAENKNNLLRADQIGQMQSIMAGLELIPSKWLVNELVLLLIETGLQASEDPEWESTINRLTRTRFFKNAYLILSESQFIHWILIAHSISSSVQATYGTSKASATMLNTWEKWLMGLAECDVETTTEEKNEEINFPAGNHEAVLEKIGTEPEKWLLYLLLGLMKQSVRFNMIIRQVCDKIKDNPEEIVPEQDKPEDILKEEGSINR